MKIALAALTKSQNQGPSCHEYNCQYSRLCVIVERTTIPYGYFSFAIF